MVVTFFRGRAVAAVLASMLALMGALFAAPAANALGYNGPTISFSFNGQILVGGSDVTVTVSTTDTVCDWTLAIDNGNRPPFADPTATGSGRVFTHTFHSPLVQQRTDYPITATCAYSQIGGAAGTALKAVAGTASSSSTITLLPVASPGSPLPGAGGPSVWWLIAGIMAMLAGGVTVYEARRRAQA